MLLPRRVGWGACLSSMMALWALEPGTPIHQYARDFWNQQQGLTGSSVKGIFQLSDGYLWLNTGGGLLRFDGVRFVPLKPSLKGEATPEPIQAMGLGCNRSLVLRGHTRTLGFNQGHLAELMKATPLPDGSVRVVAQSLDGTVWIGADNQIYRGDAKGISLLASDVSWVNAIYEDGQDGLWFATMNGLYRHSQGRLRYFPSRGYSRLPRFKVPYEVDPESRRSGPDSCNALLGDGEGGLWIGCLDGLWRWKEGKFFQDAACRAFGKGSIQALLKDRQGNLWAGTEERGLWRFAQGRWSSFGSVNGLADDCVLSLAEDREGSLWVGTRAGLARFRDGAVRVITQEDGLSSNNLWSVVESRDGSIFAVTSSAGINRISPQGIQVFNTRNGLARDSGGTLAPTQDGRVWAGTDRGLSFMEGTRAATLTAGENFRGSTSPPWPKMAMG